MLTPLSSCLIPVEWTDWQDDQGKIRQKISVRTPHKVSFGLDFVIGAALVAIGISGVLWSFMSTNLQYAMIGAGSTYLLIACIRIGQIIKNIYAPNFYLVKYTTH